jgi:hypothetical protein
MLVRISFVREPSSSFWASALTADREPIWFDVQLGVYPNDTTSIYIVQSTNREKNDCKAPSCSNRDEQHGEGRL